MPEAVCRGKEFIYNLGMRKQFLIVAVLFIIVLILGYVFSNGAQNGAGVMKNADMLKSGKSGDITVESDVTYFPGAHGYFAHPAKPGSYPGVVMIHENRGLRPEIRATADQLAGQGYMVLAVDLFGGKIVETQDEARTLTAAFDQSKGIENLRAAAAFLREHGSGKIASLGWCFGGGQSLQLALSGEPLDATVIYYGRLATSSDALSAIKWPVLGIFAGNDQSIAPESVNQFEEALSELGIPYEIKIYPGVNHAFANPSGMNYAPAETKDAWAKTLAFLKRNLQ